MALQSGTARPVGHIRLYFGDGPDAGVAKSLSAVEQIGDSLWLGADEAASVARLVTQDHAHYRGLTTFSLDSFFPLPAGPKGEVDLEGLAMDADTGRLWFVGSHSLSRGKPKG